MSWIRLHDPSFLNSPAGKYLQWAHDSAWTWNKNTQGIQDVIHGAGTFAANFIPGVFPATFMADMPNDPKKLGDYFQTHNAPKHLMQDVGYTAGHPQALLDLGLDARMGLHALGTLAIFGEMTHKGKFLASLMPFVKNLTDINEPVVEGLRHPGGAPPELPVEPHLDPSGFGRSLQDLQPAGIHKTIVKPGKAGAFEDAFAPPKLAPKDARERLRFMKKVGVSDWNSEIFDRAMAGTITVKQSEQIIKHRADITRWFGPTMEIVRFDPTERGYVDPHVHIQNLPEHEGLRDAAHKMWGTFGQVYGTQIRYHPMASPDNPLGGGLASIMGPSEADALVHSDFLASIQNYEKQLEAAGLGKINWNQITKGWEDEHIYDAMGPHEKLLVDQFRGLMGTWGEEAHNAELLSGLRGNYVPRISVKGEEGAPLDAAGAARTYKHHMTETLQVSPEGELAFMRQHDTIGDLNKSQTQRAEQFARHLMAVAVAHEPRPQTSLAASLASRRNFLKTHPEYTKKELNEALSSKTPSDAFDPYRDTWDAEKWREEAHAAEAAGLPLQKMRPHELRAFYEDWARAAEQLVQSDLREEKQAQLWLGRGPRFPPMVDVYAEDYEFDRLIQDKYGPVHKQIQALIASGQHEDAKTLAGQVAKSEYQQYETNALRIFAATMPGRMRDLKITKAMNFLSNQQMEVKGSDDIWRLINLAYKKGKNLDNDLRGIADQFKAIENRGFGDWVVHKQFADWVNGALRVPENDRLRALDKTANVGARGVTFLFPFHMANEVKRAIPFTLTNLQEIPGYLRGDYTRLGGTDRAYDETVGQLVGETSPLPRNPELEKYWAKIDAANDGVVMYNKAKRELPEMMDAWSLALNDDRPISNYLSYDTSGIAPAAHLYDPLVKVGKVITGPGRQFYHWQQDVLWDGIVNNLATAAHSIEKHKAMQVPGMPYADARILAGKRSNAWVGHIAHWDKNAALFRQLRRGFLAPSWQTTFPQIYAGLYRKRELGHNPALQHYMLKQELSTAAAFMIAHHGIGNAINLMTAGHPQWQNAPGNQGRLELSNLVPNDPQTGGRKTVDSPFASNQLADYERLFYPPSGDRVRTGIGGPEGPIADRILESERELAAKSNPVFSSVFALGNIDFYRSVLDNSIHLIDRHGHPGGPAQIGQALADFSFLGQQLSAMQRLQALKGENPWTNDALGKEWGPLAGTRLPHIVAKATPPGLAISVISTMLGSRVPWYHVPHQQAQPGSVISDDLRNKNEESLRQLRLDQDALDAEFASQSGPNSHPWDWLNQYHTNLNTEHAYLSQMYEGDPGPMSGAMGTFFQYEHIYDTPVGKGGARRADGTIDFGALRQEQDKLLSHLSEKDRHAFDVYQKQRLIHSHVARLYHSIVTRYDHEQQAQALSLGLDMNRLNTLYNDYEENVDTRAKTAFLKTHPELAKFRKSMEVWELSSPQGILYGLFHRHQIAIRAAEIIGGGSEAAGTEKLVGEAQPVANAELGTPPPGQGTGP